MKIFKIALPLFLLAAFGIASQYYSPTFDNHQTSTDSKINGVSFVASVNPLDENAFVPVANINANWVAIMPYAFNHSGATKITYNTPRQWWGERAEGVIGSIKLAQKKGLKVMLKPHVWVIGEGWTGDFTLATESDWREWENQYSNYILDYVKIADSLNVEIFCMGLEYRKVVAQRPEFWGNLADKIRTIYGGKITYAANWDNYQNIPFWDKMDYISIDAYFPLSQKDTPTVDELVALWEQPFRDIEALQLKHQKPILFTEFGYRSINKGAGRHWELPTQGTPNMEIQSNALQALFNKFWQQTWFKGGFLWKWFNFHKTAGGTDNSRHTPQNKPAELVVKNHYAEHQ